MEQLPKFNTENEDLSLVFDSAKILLTIFMNSSKESNPGTPGYSANIGLISETSF